MKLKKSQMEIMGLAIIVIILVLVMVFVLGVLSKPDDGYRDDYVANQLATNVVNTLLKTTAENCYDLDIQQLMVDCAEGSSISCDNKDSCIFANETAKFIFDNTLTKWAYKYTFEVFTDNKEIFTTSNQCSGRGIERKSQEFKIPTNIGIMRARIYVC